MKDLRVSVSHLVALSVCVLALAGCGGGAATASAPVVPIPTSTTASVSGQWQIVAHSKGTRRSVSDDNEYADGFQTLDVRPIRSGRLSSCYQSRLPPKKAEAYIVTWRGESYGLRPQRFAVTAALNADGCSQLLVRWSETR